MKTSTRTICLFIILFAYVLAAVAQEEAQDPQPQEAETEEALQAIEVIEEAEPEVDPVIEIDTLEPDELEEILATEDEAAESEQLVDDEIGDEEQVIEVEPADEERVVDEDALTEEVEMPAEAEPTAAEVEAEAPHADIFMFQGHPVFTPDQAELVYRPLVNYLNEVTPYRFDLLIARDFHRYWLDIRRGSTPDLVLEEPHITAYRIAESNYEPLVVTYSPLSYSMMTSAQNIDATLQDFVGMPVSTLPSPSLGYLVLSDWYPNPMQQPLIQSTATSWLDAIEIVFAMEAEAAMAPRTLAERYVNMENVQTSPEFPGITISASPAVPDEVREEIRQALLVLHENEDHFPALHELDIDMFVEASAEDYEGLEQWLDGAARF